jgi:predicted permease
MTHLLEDVRIALRRLRHEPGFAAVAVLTLALGLGANTAVFTLVHGLMLRSLPVERPGELVRLGDTNNCCVNSGFQTSYSLFASRLFDHLRERLASEFTDLAAFQANPSPAGVRRQGVAGIESFGSQFVSGNYFRMFGVRPAAGRLLTADDDLPDAPPVAVLSYSTWATNYGLDQAVVGGAFVVNGLAMTIVGVAAPQFFGDAIRPNPPGIWLPLGTEKAMRGAAALTDRPDTDWLYAIGRLRPDASLGRISTVSTAALQQYLAGVPTLPEEYRKDIPNQHIVPTPAGGGVAVIQSQFSSSLNILFVTSGLVLLIAAANLANLLLARADRGQAAIRAALGASPSRLLRQALTEGVIVSLIGGAAGVLVAIASARGLISLAFPGATYVPLDVTPAPLVLAFAVALAVVTGALFTAAPAWAMSRTAPLEALSGVGRSGHQRSFVPRRSLVVVQVALSVVLLIGAGLLARSLNALERQALGFDPVDRVIVRIEPPPLAGEPERLADFYRRTQEALLKIPGVVDATYALYSPMEGNNWQSGMAMSWRPYNASNPDSSPWNRVGPRYFETIGTKTLRGRALDERDTPSSARVAVVNDAFRRRFLEKGDPIGQRLGIGDASHSNDFEIVGVMADVKYTAAANDVRPMVFLPAFQNVPYDNAGWSSTQARSGLMRTIIVRTRPGAGTLEGQIRRAMTEVEPDLNIIRVLPHVDQVSVNFRIQRLMATLTSVYGLLALALASLGLYGVTAYSVSQRTREIGVRMALGADRGRIIQTVLRGPIIQTIIGLAVGFSLALLATRVIATQLYSVGRNDPAVLGFTPLVLLAAAIAAAVLPALRAASIQPTRALRGE